jgi:hypothetical protein
MKCNNKIGICICGIILSLGFIGCSSKSSEVVKPLEKPIEQKIVEPTQDELNATIKKEAVKADFVTLNGHEADFIGKSYFVEGEVTFIDDSNSVLPMFSVKTKEGDGFGMYDVVNFNKTVVVKGDKVKVYGKLSGKSDIGVPQISGNVIEK